MFQKSGSGNILERIIRKSIFKRGKTVFSKSEGCRKKFVKVQEEIS